MTHKVELKPRRKPADHPYHPNELIRGDKEIWVDGRRWGHVEMEGHGCHGPSYSFRDVNGLGIKNVNADGKEARYGFAEVHMPRRWDRNADPRDIKQRIIDMALELIAQGRLLDPAVLAKVAAANKARIARVNAEMAADDKRRREGLVAIWNRADLTNAEREALSWVYKDAFHGPIEKAAVE